MNKARAESFSDGVFAFAITLLVLGVQVPQLNTGGNQELREGLLRVVPQLLPYVTSFATIGVIWLNHHAMFHGVERVEHTTLALNLFLLMVVAFIPYPTAVLSRYGALPASAFFYGAVMTLLGLAYTFLSFHITRRRLSSLIKSDHDKHKHIGRNLMGTIIYPLSMLLAIRYPRVSILLYVLIPAYYFFPPRRRSKAPAA